MCSKVAQRLHLRKVSMRQGTIIPRVPFAVSMPLVTLMSTLASACISPGSGDGLQDKTESQFIDASATPHTTHPFGVILRETKSGRQFCAGCMLSPTQVLTAEHCVKRPPSDLSIEVFVPALDKAYSVSDKLIPLDSDTEMRPCQRGLSLEATEIPPYESPTGCYQEKRRDVAVLVVDDGPTSLDTFAAPTRKKSDAYDGQMVSKLSFRVDDNVSLTKMHLTRPVHQQGPYNRLASSLYWGPGHSKSVIVGYADDSGVAQKGDSGSCVFAPSKEGDPSTEVLGVLSGLPEIQPNVPIPEWFQRPTSKQAPATKAGDRSVPVYDNLEGLFDKDNTFIGKRSTEPTLIVAKCPQGGDARISSYVLRWNGASEKAPNVLELSGYDAESGKQRIIFSAEVTRRDWIRREVRHIFRSHRVIAFPRNPNAANELWDIHVVDGHTIEIRPRNNSNAGVESISQCDYVGNNPGFSAIMDNIPGRAL